MEVCSVIQSVVSEVLLIWIAFAAGKLRLSCQRTSASRRWFIRRLEEDSQSDVCALFIEVLRARYCLGSEMLCDIEPEIHQW